ncbi:hypothetical protein M885DRAFT_618376 [Pelagophyceae sp. CCMP2097]|nr:hypothetical protein M885DRAFT_618376 [Pelagophyceae sp. CCMP2097]
MLLLRAPRLVAARPACRSARRALSVATPQGLSAFRRLMRARAQLFKNDELALFESRMKLREEFSAQREVSEAAELVELFKGVDEIEDLLKNNIVQGKINERGNVEVKLAARNEAEARMRPMDEIPDLDFIQPGFKADKPENPLPRSACASKKSASHLSLPTPDLFPRHVTVTTTLGRLQTEAEAPPQGDAPPGDKP